MNMKGLLACTAILTSSCTMGPEYVEEDFGLSVRQMVEGQILDPEAATNPLSDPSDMLDGVAAEESLNGYRKRATHEGGAQPEIGLSVD